MNFIRESCSELSELKPTSAMFSRHDKLLQSLVAGLQIHHGDPEAGPSPDYLFFASFAYVYWLLVFESDTITTETGRDLILAILQYRERVIPGKDLKEHFYNSYGRFDNDWLSFINYATELGMVVPPTAQETPADLTSLDSAEIQERSRLAGDAVVKVLDNNHAFIWSSSKADVG